ncbi:lethal 2 denticleless protein retinoic acid-regulated nuclear matrix-associated protein [Holotrichia oblita]|uniref:Lethal 2 denticleless protein retinoic acid-regulated nuclear matrix-associated protein n=1 Tax=Holotrichia oblita TaxID=644536 RepID=A0ACB9T995_HOLOL|nr:lethal 2 denticleless protein retinoic acid-regulated nuclear matrix-associated protein [Holotrichia oblita]
MSTVQRFINQQIGIYKWRNYDSIMERLRCIDTEEFKHIYPDEDSEFYSPIFACKFAQKKGQEHILALANEDGKMAIHNTMVTKPRVGKQIHHNAIFDLAWMFNQMKIVTVSGDHTARLVDVSESELREERMFSGHTRSVKTLAIKQNDSSVFATGSRDGNILIWDTRSTSHIIYISHPDKVILNAHYSKNTTPSKRKLYQNYHPSISGQIHAGDGTIKLWDLRKTYKINKREACPKFVIPYSGSTAKCGFSNLIIDQECVKLYANCLDNTIYCYNVSNCDPNPIKKYSGHENKTFYVKSCLSSDGSYLLSGSSDHNAYIWNTRYSEPIVKLTGHAAEVTCVAWYQFYDTALVTCSDDYRHKIWKIGSEVLPENWEVHGRGLAQKIISKRCLDDIGTIIKVKKRKSCPYCDLFTEKRCENCNSNLGSLKRLPIDYLNYQSKRLHTENNTRTLFETLHPSNHRNSNLDCINEDEDEINPKRPKLEVDKSPTSIEQKLATPKSYKHSREETSPEPFSPTTNLPNFNVDGCAPHLNYSPQKRIDKDWLTKMRVERSLIHEMRERANNSIPPKIIKLDNLSPRTRSLKKQNRVTRNDRQSPLLKYFRITNNSILKDSQCVARTSLAQFSQQ